MRITVHLHKPAKGQTISYSGEVLERSPTHMLLLARWERPLTNLGYVTFAPGDLFREHFFTDRWYNLFEISTPDGLPKGWYCNITRPAIFGPDSIESEDLELDLFVPPDGGPPLVLDEDEFAARGLDTSDPAAHSAALAALDELRQLAQQRAAPFDRDQCIAALRRSNAHR